jgi:hypothetical protein
VLSKDAKAELIECLEVVSVAIEVGAEDYEDALCPAEEDHGDKDCVDQDTWGHTIEGVDVDLDWAKEFEMGHQLEEAERVKEGGKTVEEDLKLSKLGCCLEVVELFL